MTAIEHVAVVVPASDEQAWLGACLDALEVAAGKLEEAVRGVTLDVVVALDGCRDRTAEVAACYPGVRTVVTPGRCVGAARAAGSEAALGAVTVPPERVWTAHTDADSQVPADWLAGMVRRAADGDDLVLGTVEPDGDLPDGTRHAWHGRHRLVEGHPHVHGANLGIRASLLRRIGGWQPLRTGEDVDLVARALAAGARIGRTAAIPVRTSGRTAGRAPDGFAGYLRTLADAEPA